ncbi:1-deoxy-D-xylulose 5-phosphate reductoisomerase [Thiogranum longum]|uniref:1-deoxy-D-xylulose 5-phosphate reductoisomerase n=1 Tax=Thiogranum longum TaxID=1537524 RepID=A0A4R1HCT2_9GAMM|nr:1-deoxy-D-xylulose-5-phosphate reductoisomerase [Thiogranum longum]TCK18451.1 1-deoxy-D-xylulose 5-phosphate reductoisomerase [Thiogranum longum]
MKPLGMTILGATGSIGVSTLDVIERNPDRYRVIALTANRDVDGLLRQCIDHQPHYAVMADTDSAEQLQHRLRESAPDIEVLAGEEGLRHVASLDEVDCVMAAIVGAAGLMPALEAARSGKRILLANKEALVMSGALFMQQVQEGGAVLLPVDSEHNAIFQCMPASFVPGSGHPDGVSNILLTASGGPFRTTPVEKLAGITPEQACAHPNWDMGRKISVDSATMMNKGLEVIEACWLFSTDATHVQVVIHPQSVIHSMVQYLDGSVLAQLGNPDMRTPIAHCMAWPERIDAGVQALDIVGIGRLDFEAPDLERFPCLRLAQEAWQSGGTASAVLNAANEIAVDAFLNHQLAFTAIPGVIETTLAHVGVHDASTLEVILDADHQAREYAGELISGASSFGELA